MPLVKSVRGYLPNTDIKVYKHDQSFDLECGDTLPGLEIAYTTYGTLSENKDNVVWVFHALTANADPVEWWPGLVGEGHFINPDEHFIVCANMLGSCYGTTGPDSIDPNTGDPYGMDFPNVTVKDMVKAHKVLRKALDIDKIWLGIGGSMGGQQLLEWAVDHSTLFDNICAIATNAQHSAWGIAFNESQRMAMTVDDTLFEKHENAGAKGLEAARAVAMLSYRNQKTYKKAQTDTEDKIDNYSASSYQRYQGEKLRKRFSAHAYWRLSKAMDSHNIGRGRKSVSKALKSIEANTLSLGIKSDLLFPISEQKYIAKKIDGAVFGLVKSLYGHDGFLIEAKAITRHIDKFLNRTKK